MHACLLNLTFHSFSHLLENGYFHAYGCFVCMYVYCVHAMPMGARRERQNPKEWHYGELKPPYRFWKQTSGVLEEQPGLLIAVLSL